MNREELKEYIGVTASSLGHVEKDYFQHIVLGALSRRWSAYLVFKGGTALQKIGVVPRFSEDLDFTEQKEISPERIADTVSKAIGSYNYPAEFDSFSDQEMTAGFRMKIQGPLYRNNRGLCSIRLEVSRREEVIRSPSVEEIDPHYRDILPYVIRVMDRGEIAAEKVRAILTRDQVRDLYDLSQLVKKGVDLDRGLVDLKLKYYDMKLEVSDLVERCRTLSKRWERDLGTLIESVPPRDEALEAVFSVVEGLR